MLKMLQNYFIKRKVRLVLVGILLMLIPVFLYKRVNQTIKLEDFSESKVVEVYYSLVTQVGWEQVVIDENNQAFFLSTIQGREAIKSGKISEESVQKIKNSLSENNFFKLNEIYRRNSSLTETPYRTLVITTPNNHTKVRVERHDVPEEIKVIETVLMTEVSKFPLVTTKSQAEQMCEIFFTNFNQHKESYQSSEAFMDSCLSEAYHLVETLNL